MQRRAARADRARTCELLPRKPVQRIGLSATQRPLERIAKFLVGPGKECEIVDAGVRKELDLEIVVPVEDMADPGLDRSGPDGAPTAPGTGPDPSAPTGSTRSSPASPTTARSGPRSTRSCSSWSSEHTSTIIFVNNRRGAERLAKRLNELKPSRSWRRRASPPTGRPPEAPRDRDLARAHHGSLAHEERTEVEELLKSGQLPCLVATSSLELGIDMGAVDLVIQVESPKSVARGLQRVGRAGHELGAVSKGRIFPKFRADLLECAVVAKQMRTRRDRGDGDPAEPARRARPAPRLDGRRPRVGGRRGRAHRQGDRALRRPLPRAARERARHARRPLPVRALRRAAAADRLGPDRRARSAAARAPASLPSPTRARSPTAASTASTCPTAAGSASSTRRWSTRRGRARSSCSAPRPGGSRRSPATA